MISRQEEGRLRVAAARHDQSIRDYVWEAVEARLLLDGIVHPDRKRPSAITAESDPVLASLWDNSGDAAYDDL